MQYFQASDDKRADIVQVIGNLLGLAQQEIEQVWKSFFKHQTLYAILKILVSNFYLFQIIIES